jgi:hypothetical protein
MSAISVPPSVALLQLASGSWIGRAISVAAKLGIADLLSEGPRDCDDLSRAVGVHSATLYRLLRALASVGVFAEAEDGRFGLTPLADCLRTDTQTSIRAYATMPVCAFNSGVKERLVRAVIMDILPGLSPTHQECPPKWGKPT